MAVAPFADAIGIDAQHSRGLAVAPQVSLRAVEQSRNVHVGQVKVAGAIGAVICPIATLTLTKHT